MLKFLSFVFLAWALAGCGRSAQGKIDGTPIPEKLLTMPSRDAAIKGLVLRGISNPSEEQIQAARDAQVCTRLRGYVDQAVTERQIKDLGIVVTPEEEAAARAKLNGPSTAEAVAAMRDRATLLPQAFADVDHGEDPHQVFVEQLQPHGITEQEWMLDLQRKTPESRAKLVKGYAVVAQKYADGTWRNDINVKTTIAKGKMDAELDRQLAREDSEFREYLQERQQKSWVPQHVQQYLDTKRNNWWQAERAKVKVQLNDPALASKCGVGN